MRLLFVRHGQMRMRAHQGSSLEAINRFASQQAEFGLSDRGRSEASRVAAHFRSGEVHALYCSPLARARETAEIIGRDLAMPIVERTEIREVLTGGIPPTSRRGQVIDQIAKAPLPFAIKRGVLGSILIPVYYTAWQSGQTEGGESPIAFRARLENFFSELRGTLRHDAKVVAVAHGYLMFNLALMSSRDPLQKARIWTRPYIPNGGIVEFELPSSGDLELRSYSYTGHL